ncbi:MAG: hypothetical protein K0S38_293 [Candidatus Paceibacter sp.]|jgi:hypothetical protein|nr:hypothetical protein [Candidatus Paceibacter sp.]
MNQKRYWLRGGMWGLVFGYGMYFTMVFATFHGKTTEVFANLEAAYTALLYGFFFSLPIAILGIIVGLIYGKIKNRNKTI